jgi:hypothetical protein
MHELNTAYYYPPAARVTLAVWYRDWLSKQQPASLSPVFLVTCPLLTRDGRTFLTLSRTQLYYDEKGDFSWCLSVLDYWRDVGEEEVEGEAGSPPRVSVENELEALLQECQPSPASASSLDDDYAALLKTLD